MPKIDLTLLRSWFLSYRRALPWRSFSTPYAIWVSEVMLQQTQVSTVIPYFIRRMERFPNLKDLAQSNWEEIMKLWEGLGYYTRAKNLFRGAQYICENFDGIIPDKEEELKKIPGLGPYTIGAIRSFAFKQRAVAVDGNVMRVIARYYGIQEDISKMPARKKIWDFANQLLPEIEPWIISEALIELGALICKKRPLCSHCPIKRNCQAHTLAIADQLPRKTKSKPITSLYRAVLILFKDQQILIHRIPEGQVMGGLYEFPFLEVDHQEIALQDVETQLRKQFNIQATFVNQLKAVRHHFTRFRAHLQPWIFICDQIPVLPQEWFWASYNELRELAFSSGHRRLLEQLASCNLRYL